jgi:hypothetical protein
VIDRVHKHLQRNIFLKLNIQHEIDKLLSQRQVFGSLKNAGIFNLAKQVFLPMIDAVGDSVAVAGIDYLGRRTRGIRNDHRLQPLAR